VNTTFRMGRVAGIEVGAHWSWLLVVALIVWSLSAGVFPQTDPGLDDRTYLAMAIVAALGFFASILLHELGHALQARRDGIPVDGIILWVFGGVARMNRQPPSAMAELRVALAGPAVSLALGLVLLLAAQALRLPPAVDGTLFWLGQMNLYLLAFNLLPAFPLDGGRVARALLWARRGSFASATRTASAVGRGFAQLFIGIGLALAIFVGDFGGLWLAFIGWFLLAAAEAELALAGVGDSVDGLRVWQVMVRDPVTVPADATVEELMTDVFLPTRHTAFPVVDGGRAAGIVSFRDALALPRSAWATTPVSAIMETAAEACVDPAAPLAEVLPRLATGRLRRLLVCRDGRLYGLLSLSDAMRVLEVRSRLAEPAVTRERLDGYAARSPLPGIRSRVPSA
jgi:Zn-dependent protease/CBS domain-containing protein